MIRPAATGLLLSITLLAPATAQGKKPRKVNRELAIATGKALLEGSSDAARRRGLAKARALGAAEQRVLLAWAKGRVSDPGIGNLLPLLRTLDSQSAAEVLVEIASAPRGEEDDGSLAEEALDALLFAHPSKRSIPLATSAILRTSDSHAAGRIQSALLDLVREGPDEEKISRGALRKALVVELRKALRGRDLPPVARARAVSFLADWLVQTDELKDVLALIKRRLEDPDAIFLDALLQGVPRRQESLRRPIDLLRAREVNRRNELEPEAREQLARLEDWLEDRVSRDKRLSVLARRIARDDATFQELLLDLLASEEASVRVKLEVLGLAPRFGQDADSPWVPLLIAQLDKERAVASRAYGLLKQITGESIPQNAVLWDRWLKGEDQKTSGGGE